MANPFSACVFGAAPLLIFCAVTLFYAVRDRFVADEAQFPLSSDDSADRAV